MSFSTILPKVSIVIPVYNGSNYLKEAIDSALAQTYANIEILVINDGSRDSGATEEIAKSYGSRIRYYKKQNGGVASALNLGIKMMTGEYFSWLSHDDMYEKTKIEEQINYLNKSQDKNIVIACKAKVLFPSGIKKKENINVEAFQHIDIFLATSAQVGVNGCSLLIPKRAFEACGDFDIKLPLTQDYDLWFRLKDRFKFVLLDKFLVISRRHEEQDSVQKHNMLLSAGDRLHYRFMCAIPYERFKKYFRESERNILHTYDNYKLYKARGYKKTASMILMNILKYYHEDDKASFYKLFNVELGRADSGTVGGNKNNNKISDNERMHMDLEYEKLINSGINGFLNNLIVSSGATTVHRPELSKSPLKRAHESIKRDGVLLTGEKVLRKAYKNLSKRKK